jgi:hypothetical protein
MESERKETMKIGEMSLIYLITGKITTRIADLLMITMPLIPMIGERGMVIEDHQILGIAKKREKFRGGTKGSRSLEDERMRGGITITEILAVKISMVITLRSRDLRE